MREHEKFVGPTWAWFAPTFVGDVLERDGPPCLILIYCYYYYSRVRKRGGSRSDVGPTRKSVKTNTVRSRRCFVPFVAGRCCLVWTLVFLLGGYGVRFSKC